MVGVAGLIAVVAVGLMQVDTRSTVPSWMSGLVADGGRYGLYGGHDLQLPTETRGSSSSTGKLKGGEEDEEEAGQGSRTDSGESSASSTASATCPSALPPALSVQDFQPLSVIGRGGFGKVFLVRRKANGTVSPTHPPTSRAPACHGAHGIAAAGVCDEGAEQEGPEAEEPDREGQVGGAGRQAGHIKAGWVDMKATLAWPSAAGAVQD